MRGQLAMGFAASAGALAVMIAVTLNLNSAMSQRQDLQAIADETALALAVEINILTQNDVDLNSVALARLNTHLADSGRQPLQSSEVVVRTLRTQPDPVPAPTNGVPHDTVELTITTYRTSSVASSALNKSPKPIRVTSQALRLGSSNLCVIGLHAISPNTLLARDSARLTAPNCDVFSNSLDTNGLTVTHSARIEANEIHSAGGATGQPSAFIPAPVTDSLIMSDPLAGIPEPETTPCTQTGLLSFAAGFNTLNPGIYCGGMTITNDREVFLNPGVYTFLGDVTINNGGILRGDYVTLHMAGGSSRFRANHSSTVNLTAPKTGATAGILFFESPSHDLNTIHTIKSIDARYLVGTIYVPRGIFDIDTTASVSDQSEYTAIVARRLVIRGSSNLYLNTDYGATDVPVPDGVGPIDEGTRLVH